MGDPVGDDARLPASRPGQHQERPLERRHGLPLVGVQAAELDAVLGKLQTNEHRYPVDEFRGRFRRPERDKEGEQ